MFGAVNTMYAAVSSRTPEIAVLLTLGFKPRNVLMSFLAESAVIAFLGGLIGCLLALPINGVVTSTTNWSSFSEIAFAFRVTPQLLLSGVIFAVLMGSLGDSSRLSAGLENAGGPGLALICRGNPCGCPSRKRAPTRGAPTVVLLAGS